MGEQDDPMDEGFLQKVRERAYALWQDEGRPEGRDAEFWLTAEQEVHARDQEAPAEKPPAASAA
jgi:hypothetical protein